MDNNNTEEPSRQQSAPCTQDCLRLKVGWSRTTMPAASPLWRSFLLALWKAKRDCLPLLRRTEVNGTSPESWASQRTPGIPLSYPLPLCAVWSAAKELTRFCRRWVCSPGGLPKHSPVDAPQGQNLCAWTSGISAPGDSVPSTAGDRICLATIISPLFQWDSGNLRADEPSMPGQRPGAQQKKCKGCVCTRQQVLGAQQTELNPSGQKYGEGHHVTNHLVQNLMQSAV